MGHGYGIKYQNEDFVYVCLKKHDCPHCKTKVKTVMVKKNSGKSLNVRLAELILR